MNQLQSFSAFLDSFGSIPSSLIHATLMLSVACALTWMLVRGVSLRSARLRQFVFLCVLLQGVMLFRLPIELPVYTETESGQAFDSPIGQPADWTEPSRLSQLQNQADATIDNEVVSDASAVTGVFEASLLQDSTSGIVTAQLVLLVWAIGASLILFFALSRYLLLCRLVGRLPRASEPWQTHWNDICRRGGVFAPRMVIGQTLGPMLVRRIRGYVLVVPSQYWQSLTLEERESVLLHECAHLKRRDVYRQAFVRAIALLHWFNPSAWWAVRRYEESTEWACDEYMMRHNQTHAVGLATALVRLVEMGSEASDRHVGGFGVQAMAAPPLLDRVKRLLNQKPSEDRIMQRWCFLLLAAGLMIVSAFQFRLVEAAQEQPDEDSPLRVVAGEVEAELQRLETQLDSSDTATGRIIELLDTESGRIAFAGLMDELADRERESMRGEAVGNFMAKYFEETADSNYKLLPSSREASEDWILEAASVARVNLSIQERFAKLAGDLRDDSIPGQMMRRLLTDNEIGYALILEAFEGRSDPIDLFISEAMERTLVARGEKMIVIPTLSADARAQLERFSTAEKIFSILELELDSFADEFATADDRHRRFVDMLKRQAGKAIVAATLSERRGRAPASQVEDFFQQLEEISKDTPGGLVIREEEAWEDIHQIIELAERAEGRSEQVRARLTKLAATLDTDDQATSSFKESLTGNVMPFFIASEIPYAEFDIACEIESRLREIMIEEGGGLKIREDAVQEVNERASELLSISRRLRRYLRRVGTVISKIDDVELKEALGDSGAFVMFVEMRREAEAARPDPVKLVVRELFEKQGDRLTIRPDRQFVVDELFERAAELESELARDDF